VDISQQVLVEDTGFCGLLGSCDVFTDEECTADQRCHFAYQADLRQLVTFCIDRGDLVEGDVCQQQGSNDACGDDLVCLGQCRRLCDTGGYRAPCPQFQECREALGFTNQPYRNLGVCVTSQ
tara:strand:- start:16 stop:381 length:366 start_codon:yes stop_codon:yes gene_type:complete